MRQLGACLCGGELKSLLCSPGLRWCERARGACHLARAERRIILAGTSHCFVSLGTQEPSF